MITFFSSPSSAWPGQRPAKLFAGLTRDDCFTVFFPVCPSCSAALSLHRLAARASSHHTSLGGCGSGPASRVSSGVCRPRLGQSRDRQWH